LWKNTEKRLIEISLNAKFKAQSKSAGYEQITYKWNDGVIQKTIPGSGGTKPATYILSGDRWVPRYEWQAAIDARQAGTATPKQIQILDKGHW
jgi:hypothetical protein